MNRIEDCYEGFCAKTILNLQTLLTFNFEQISMILHNKDDIHITHDIYVGMSQFLKDQSWGLSYLKVIPLLAKR